MIGLKTRSGREALLTPILVETLDAYDRPWRGPIAPKPVATVVVLLEPTEDKIVWASEAAQN